GHLVKARTRFAQRADRDIHFLPNRQRNFLRESVQPAHIVGIHVVKLAETFEILTRDDVMGRVGLHLFHLMARPTAQLLDEAATVIQFLAAFQISLGIVAFEATGLHILCRTHRLHEEFFLFPVVILLPHFLLGHFDDIGFRRRYLLRLRIIVVLLTLRSSHPLFRRGVQDVWLLLFSFRCMAGARKRCFAIPTPMANGAAIGGGWMR